MTARENVEGTGRRKESNSSTLSTETEGVGEGLSQNEDERGVPQRTVSGLCTP